MSEAESGPNPAEMGIETEAPEAQKTLGEIVDEKVEEAGNLIKEINEEGEIALFRIFQGVEIATGRKYHPEILRKILGEKRGPLEKIDDYRNKVAKKNRMTTSLSAINHLFYGTLSMGARKIVEKMFQATANFGRGVANLSDRAADRFSDARKLYGIPEESVGPEEPEAPQGPEEREANQ